jgi:hypothetical protein
MSSRATIKCTPARQTSRECASPSLTASKDTTYTTRALVVYQASAISVIRPSIKGTTVHSCFLFCSIIDTDPVFVERTTNLRHPVISNPLHPCMDSPRRNGENVVTGQLLPGPEAKRFMRLMTSATRLSAVSHVRS